MQAQLDFTPWPADLRERYVRAGYWIGEPLLDILSTRVARHPHKTAIIGPDRQLSFTELNEASDRLARYLLTRQLKAGDHALVQLPSGAHFYVVFWALLKIGVKPVFALFHHNAHELESFCRPLQPKLLIVSRQHKLFATDQYLDTQLRAAANAEVVLFEGDSAEASNSLEAILAGEAASVNGDADVAFPAIRAHEVAFFQLSGGSTNTPKLIPRTHDDYYYSVRRSAEVCELSENTVYLCALPIPHNFPMSSPGVLGVWYAGGTVVVAADPSPKTCFPLIETHRVTITSLVPPMVTLWLEAAQTRAASLASLRLLQVGGAKLPENLAQRIEPVLGCRLQQVFGMAEGLVCYTRLDDDDWHRFHTQGRPMSEADELKILDEEGNLVADGQEGALWTRGPYTFRGYFRAADHNRQVFDAEGFYKTGDLVQRSPQGYLTVVGREKDQINRGGEKIAAEEVENLLLSFPGISQVAIVAMPDENLGEKSCAFLICSGDMPKAHLMRRHLRELGIADYKLPDHFVKIEALPLTAVGKPDKLALRKRLLAARSASGDKPSL